MLQLGNNIDHILIFAEYPTTHNLEPDMEQRTDSKLGKEYVKAV